MEIIGQGLRHERGLVDPLEWRVGLVDHIEIHGGLGEERRAQIETARQPVGGRALGVEPGQDISGREFGEQAERGQAQTLEHLGELRATEGANGKGGQKGRTLQRRNDDGVSARGAVSGGKGGGEGAVGDPHTDRGGRDESFGEEFTHPLGERAIAPEVARRPLRGEQTGARPDDLGTRGDVVEQRHQRLERPGLTIGVAVDEDRLRAESLCLATTHPHPHPERTRHPAGGDHPVRRHDHHRAVDRPFQRHGRPIGAPDHHRTGRSVTPAIGNTTFTGAGTWNRDHRLNQPIGGGGPNRPRFR